jgi:hypothetical protein
MPLHTSGNLAFCGVIMKRRLTMSEHAEVGADLKRIQNRLQKLTVFLQRRYPNNSRVVRQSERANNAVDQLRCVMDDTVFAEHGDRTTHELSQVYYG